VGSVLPLVERTVNCKGKGKGKVYLRTGHDGPEGE